MGNNNREEKLKTLAEDVIDMDSEISFLEYQVAEMLHNIKQLNPTKKEIQELDLEDLFISYEIELK